MKRENELIAKFMGVPLCLIQTRETQYLDHKIVLVTDNDDINYHNSWDKLMPVIQKIGNLEIKFKDSDEYYNPYTMTFGMQSEEGMYLFRFAYHALYDHQNLIEAAYEAVVDFIKRNNQN